jgi:hypothetical protein
MPPSDVIRETSIVMSNYNRPFVYDCGYGGLTAIGPIQPFANNCGPSISGNGSRVAACQIDANDRASLYTMNLDGSDRKMVFQSTVGNCEETSFSPDGRSILFQMGTGRIYSVPASGGVATALTPSDKYSFNAAWSPDGNKIAYCQYDSDMSLYKAMTMNKDGSESAEIPTSDRSDAPIHLSWMPGTYTFLETYHDGAGYHIARLNPGRYCIDVLQSTTPLYHASASPTGDRFVFAQDGPDQGVYVYDLDLGYKSRIANFSRSSMTWCSPSWGPYAPKVTLVGKGGPLGSLTGGFMFGQLAKHVTSIVAFDAVTRSTLQVKTQDNVIPGESVVVCVLMADSLKSLKYMNNVRGGATVVVSPGSPVDGAIVSLDANDGKVATVAPYTGPAPSSTGSHAFTGRFVGVWDSKGKNLAPNGARALAIDAKTGVAKGF